MSDRIFKHGEEKIECFALYMWKPCHPFSFNINWVGFSFWDVNTNVFIMYFKFAIKFQFSHIPIILLLIKLEADGKCTVRMLKCLSVFYFIIRR